MLTLSVIKLAPILYLQKLEPDDQRVDIKEVGVVTTGKHDHGVNPAAHYNKIMLYTKLGYNINQEEHI